MKTNRANCVPGNFERCSTSYCDALRETVAPAKQALLQEYQNQVGEHSQLLRLALNEAEALAWETDYPHLLFPMLAVEKAQAAVAWHQRQQLMRPTVSLAFAE